MSKIVDAFKRRFPWLNSFGQEILDPEPAYEEVNPPMPLDQLIAHLTRSGSVPVKSDYGFEESLEESDDFDVGDSDHGDYDFESLHDQMGKVVKEISDLKKVSREEREAAIEAEVARRVAKKQLPVKPVLGVPAQRLEEEVFPSPSGSQRPHEAGGEPEGGAA